jgi:hypothetical protein
MALSSTAGTSSASTAHGPSTFGRNNRLGARSTEDGGQEGTTLVDRVNIIRLAENHPNPDETSPL